jgi:hypothetical protein
VSEHRLIRGHSAEIQKHQIVSEILTIYFCASTGSSGTCLSKPLAARHEGSPLHPTMDLLASMFPALQSLSSLSIYQSLLILVTAYLFTKALLSINAKGPLPPGPRGLPVLGNIFQIPKFQWLKYTEWQEVFGNLFSLSVSFASEGCQVQSFH